MLMLQAISNTEISSVTSKPIAQINALAFSFVKEASVSVPSVVYALLFRATRKPFRRITCERVKQYIIFQAPSNVSEDLQT